MLILIWLISLVFGALEALVIAGVILSWIHLMRRPPRWAYSPWALWLDDAFRAIVRPFRNLLYRWRVNTGPIDIAPLLALLTFHVARDLIVWLLLSIGRP